MPIGTGPEFKMSRLHVLRNVTCGSLTPAPRDDYCGSAEERGVFLGACSFVATPRSAVSMSFKKGHLVQGAADNNAETYEGIT